MPQMVVSALHLNLRSSPSAATSSNRIATLSQGTVVDVISAAGGAWVSIEVNIAGSRVRGFVNGSFLAPMSTTFPAATGTSGALPRADLGTSTSATRAHDGSRAHAIGERGLPGVPSTHSGGKAAGLVAILNWLNPGDSGHLRWWPKTSTTFCNIYVYDVCCLGGGYIPRVWWTSSAVAKLQAGQTVDVKYGVTVTELAANYMFNWLVEYGADYGWTRVFTCDDLQAAANRGDLALICAQRTDMSRPGHIQMVAPEHGTHRATRNAAGNVTNPLQSNAGRTNFTFGQMSTNWYKGSAFREFGFWIASSG